MTSASPSAFNSTHPVIHYNANGSQTEFTFPFIVFAAEQLQVLIDNIRKTDGYHIQGLNHPDGGKAIFDMAPPNGAVVTLKRYIPIRRISNFIEGGELSSRALNAEFDQNIAIAQQLELSHETAIRFPDGEANPQTKLPPKNVRANRLLGFNDQGDLSTFNPSSSGSGGSEPIAADYIQKGDGAILRQVTDHIAEHISVTDFGAKGDGIADDTQAFRAALAAHDCVFVPDGTYRLTETIELTAHKTLYGNGALSVLTTEDAHLDLLEITGAFNRIAHLTLQNGETGLRLYGKNAACRDNLIQNLHFINQSTALELDGYIAEENSCDHNTIQNIIIRDAKNYGILVTRSGGGSAPKRNQFSNIRILSDVNGIAIAAIAVESAKEGNLFSHCSMDIYGEATALVTIGSESENTLFNDLRGISHSPMNGIHLMSGSSETQFNTVHITCDGNLLSDDSEGAYHAENLGTENRYIMKSAEITSLLMHQPYYQTKIVTPPGPIAVDADLSCGVYLLDAVNGQVTFILPKADDQNKGAVITAMKIDNSNNAIMIFEDNGTGPNDAVFNMSAMHDRITVISDGHIWRIINTNIRTSSIRTVSGLPNYILDISKDFHLVSATNAAVNVTLPKASGELAKGRVITVKKGDTTSHIIKVIEAGGQGPDKAAVELKSVNQSVTVISNGVNWLVLART